MERFRQRKRLYPADILTAFVTTFARGDVKSYTAFVRVTFYGDFVRRVATQEVSVRIQHCREVRTDIVLVEIEVKRCCSAAAASATRLLFR